MIFYNNSRFSRLSISLLFGAVATLGANAPAVAKPYSPLTLSVSRIATFDAEVNNTGYEVQRDTWLFGVKSDIPLNQQWSISLNANYDKLDFDWSGRGAGLMAGQLSPWSSVDRYSAGVGLSYRPNQRWMFLFAPKIQYAYTEDASRSNAQSYGVVASGMYRFNNGNMLGLGVAYLNDISEVRTVPYLAVNWQISDRLKLGNPFSAGFSGPAGLELSYKLSDDIDAGVGASKRTQRFLVKDDNVAVEIDEWASFVRAGWVVNESLSLNGYIGYYFNGEMELSDPNHTDTLDNQLAMAFAAQYKF